MASDYRLQVVDSDGRLASSWEPGSQAERDFIAAIVEAVKARPVGVLATRTAVAAEVETALRDYLHQLKSTVRP